MVGSIRYIDVACGVNRNTIWLVELPVTTALTAPFPKKSSSATEFLDAMVVAIRHIDIACGINRNTSWIAELPVTVARTAPLGKKSSSATEFLDAMVVATRYIDNARVIRVIKRLVYCCLVVAISYIDIARGINRNISWIAELPVTAAKTPPLGKKDSSATK